MKVWRSTSERAAQYLALTISHSLLTFIFGLISWGVKDEPEATPDEGAQGPKVDLAPALQFHAVTRYHWPHDFLSQVSAKYLLLWLFPWRLSFAFVSTGTGEETEDFSVRSKDLWVKYTDNGSEKLHNVATCPAIWNQIWLEMNLVPTGSKGSIWSSLLFSGERFFIHQLCLFARVL